MSSQVTPDAPLRPGAVRHAVALMVFGAVVQALNTLATALDRDGIRTRTAHLAQQYKGRTLRGDELEHATDQAYWFSLGTGVAFVCLWLVVARWCFRGRAAGRGIATVLAIVYTFTFLVSGFATIGPGTLIGLVLALIGIASVYFLWHKPVTSWLAARPAGTGRERD